VPHGGQGKIDEKFLGAGFFQESAEKDKENHVGGQNIGHDAEHAVALVEDLVHTCGNVSPAWANRSGM
jgi:hypothetical protein